MLTDPLLICLFLFKFCGTQAPSETPAGCLRLRSGVHDPHTASRLEERTSIYQTGNNVTRHSERLVFPTPFHTRPFAFRIFQRIAGKHVIARTRMQDHLLTYLILHLVIFIGRVGADTPVSGVSCIKQSP